ncbi:MAG: single-stranded DNA-binding protein [Bacteriovorax sp.]|jgi:single-strand DNA-binding protein
MNNKIELIAGRLGVDPRLAYTKKGEPVCEMSVGLVNEQNETVWRKIVVFGRLAEQCSVHLRKGGEVFARGPIVLKKFTNREGHEKEYLELKAFSIGQSLI